MKYLDCDYSIQLAVVRPENSSAAAMPKLFE
jgi:hypothetical protein